MEVKSTLSKTAQQFAEAVKLYAKCMSYRKIAKKLKVPKSTTKDG